MPLPFEYEEWIHTHKTAISAASASLIATSIGFPLDRQGSLVATCALANAYHTVFFTSSIKSRLQVSKYNGVADCARKIYKHEGLQGFFRGKRDSYITLNVSYRLYRPHDAAVDHHAGPDNQLHNL